MKSKHESLSLDLFSFLIFKCFLCCREIKQKNEGGWDFYWDEDSKPGHIILDVRVAKHLDSSLIDVDVHPTYVSVVIKSKVSGLTLCKSVKYSF